MGANLVDVAIVERTIERRLRLLGLSPCIVANGVNTGCEGLDVFRNVSELVLNESKDGQIKVYAAVEFRTAMNHRTFGQADVLDLIAVRADSAEHGLERCANTYMDVTFPPIHSLFLGRAAAGASEMQLSSYVPPHGQAIRWQLYAGQLQIVNDPRGRLKRRLADEPPITLLLNTLTGYLAAPTLHWCKLYIGQRAGRALTCGCSIDGMKVADAETEISSKFRAGGTVPGNWELRQFFLMHPAGAADEQAVTRLRADAERFGRR